MLVNPRSQISLPLRYWTMRIVRIAVRLGIGNEILLMVLPRILASLPPVVHSLKAFLKVTTQHSVQENLSLETILDKFLYRSLTSADLRMSVATETYSAVYPLDFRHQFCKLVSDNPCIVGLVEVYLITSLDNLLELLNGIAARGKEIVVHKNKLCPALNGQLVNVHVRSDTTCLLYRYNAPRTFVRASSRQEAVCGIARNVGIDGIIGLQAVNLIRQPTCDVVASTPP